MSWLIDWRVNHARTAGGPRHLLSVNDVVEFTLRASGDTPAGHRGSRSAQESDASHHQNWERRFALTVTPFPGSPRTVMADESTPLRLEYRFDHPGTKQLLFTGTPRRRREQTTNRGRTESRAFDPVEGLLTIEVLDQRAFAEAIRRGRVSPEPVENRPVGEVAATTRGAAAPDYQRAAEARRRASAALEAYRRATEEERSRRGVAGATPGLVHRSFHVRSEAEFRRSSIEDREEYLFELNHEVACTPPLDLNDIPLPGGVGFSGVYHWDFDESGNRVEFFRVPAPRPYVQTGGGGYQLVYPDQQARERWQREERRRAIAYRRTDWLVVIPPGEVRPLFIAAPLLLDYIRRQVFLNVVETVADVLMFLVPIEGWILGAFRGIVSLVEEARLAAAIVRFAARLRVPAGRALGAAARPAATAGERTALNVVGRAVDRTARATGARATTGRVAGPEVWQELGDELGLAGTTGGRKPAARTSGADAVSRGLADADRLGFTSYNTGSSVRAELGISATTQSAHVLPQAVGRYIPGYSPGRALTTPLPTETHGLFDAGWEPQWNAAIRAGREITAGDVERWVGHAIYGVPSDLLSPEAKGAVHWRLFQELRSFGLTPESVIVAARP